MTEVSPSSSLPAVLSSRRLRRVRTERLIAGGRLVLGIAALVAVWADPTTPTLFPRTAYTLLVAYAVWAVVLAASGWNRRVEPAGLALATHAVDLAAFSALMFATEGPTSPFFLFFVFALLAAALRWGWRGTVATGTAAAAVFVALGAWAASHLGLPNFELDRFIVRGAYLLVLTALVAYLGRHQERERREIASVATWSLGGATGREGVAAEVLERAGAVLASPWLALVWEEEDEPWQYRAVRSGDGTRLDRLAPEPEVLALPVALAGQDLVWYPAGAAGGIIATATGTFTWTGTLHPELPAARAVLVLELRGERCRGRLLAAARRFATEDDLVIGRVVARLVAARLDQAVLVERLQERAAADERLRLARDLHDGALQLLAGTAFEVASLEPLVAADPGRARERIRLLGETLAAQQRDLRRLIETLKAPEPPGSSPVTCSDLEPRLAALAERMRVQWGLAVALSGTGCCAGVPTALANELFHLVHEALSNIARHAGATHARVELQRAGGAVRVAVADDGRGFPFHGRFDGAALADAGTGPRMLRERVEALGGTLLLDSGPDGARVEILIPSPAEAS